jgi:hypothetical protein
VIGIRMFLRRQVAPGEAAAERDRSAAVAPDAAPVPGGA